MSDKVVTLIASGDLRQPANGACWPAQCEVEDAVTDALESEDTTSNAVMSSQPCISALEAGP